MLFCDLDGFKVVNDNFGHDAGDTVLVEVAVRLRSAVRDGDTVARYGGDEFVVLCAGDVDSDGLVALADRIDATVREPVELDGGTASLGVSVGIAEAARPTTTSGSSPCAPTGPCTGPRAPARASTPSLLTTSPRCWVFATE